VAAASARRQEESEVTASEIKQKVAIVTDSACDLPRQLVEQLKITVVPLVVRFGSEVHDDGELPADEFWEKAAGPHHPETSQPSVGAFEEAFDRLVARGKQVICVALTSKHSGTFNAAHVAARRFRDAVSVFDSLSISLGEGLQALAAAQAARAGRSLQEILPQLQALRSRMHVSVVLSTLENIRRGGRADALIPIVDRMAKALNIKAVIDVVDGQLRLGGAARSLKSGVRRLVEKVEALGPLEYLGVLHTRIPDKAAELADELAERLGFPRRDIWIREPRAALSAHAGPGAIGTVAVPAESQS
jgi:DegV family protein with EDD domain